MRPIVPYTVLQPPQHCMDARRALRLLCAMLDGHQIARITCNRCRHAVDVDPDVLKDLRGRRLFRALKCSRCGAREADVSIRWELAPAHEIKVSNDD
jgi:hypothetical protein